MGSNSRHQVNSNMVIRGRSQYSQVEESGRPCADLWRNPWSSRTGNVGAGVSIGIFGAGELK
jgi:hypothetical protein